MSNAIKNLRSPYCSVPWAYQHESWHLRLLFTMYVQLFYRHTHTHAHDALSTIWNNLNLQRSFYIHHAGYRWANKPRTSSASYWDQTLVTRVYETRCITRRLKCHNLWQMSHRGCNASYILWHLTETHLLFTPFTNGEALLPAHQSHKWSSELKFGRNGNHLNLNRQGISIVPSCKWMNGSELSIVFHPMKAKLSSG